MPSASISTQQFLPSPTDADMRSFSTDLDDEEVDQLDSSTDEDLEEEEVGAGSSSSNKTRLKNGGERVPGRTILPTSRTTEIIDEDGVLSVISEEAIFLLTAATEEFIKRLTGAAHQQTVVARRTTVNYRDIAFAAHQNPEFQFLDDTLPQPISLVDALKRRAEKEKEVLEETPAISVSAIPAMSTPLPSGAPSISLSSKAKGKGRQTATNGTSEPNKSASVGTGGTKRTRERKARQSEPAKSSTAPSTSTMTMTTRRQSSRMASRDADQSSTATSVSAAPTPPMQVNGDHPETNGSALVNAPEIQMNGGRPLQPHDQPASRNAMGPPALPTSNQLGDCDTPSHFMNILPEESWPPAHYTGPASGYLEDHRMIFNGRGGIMSNPGRTIYSARQPNR